MKEEEVDYFRPEPVPRTCVMSGTLQDQLSKVREEMEARIEQVSAQMAEAKREVL